MQRNDIAAASAAFDDSPPAVELPVQQYAKATTVDEVAEMSRQLNREMVIDQAKKIAENHGMRADSVTDLRKIASRQRLGHVSRPPPMAAGIGVPTSVSTSTSATSISVPTPTSTYTPTNNPAPTSNPAPSAPVYPLTEVIRGLSNGLTLVRIDGEPVHDNTTTNIRCAHGHVHRCLTAYIVKNGLTTCHTCKCTDPITTALRKYMELICEAPFITEGTAHIKNETLRIYINRSQAHTHSRLRQDKGLYIDLPLSVGADVLKLKLKQTKYALPDGRKLRDLVSDDELKFDETDPLQITFDDSATSFTSFMDNITTPQCKVQVKWD